MIKPMTEEERKASLDRALKNAKEHSFDDLSNYFEYSGGRLFRLTGRYKGCEAGFLKDGYFYCKHKGRNELVHRLVWSLFFGPIPQGFVVDHINRDKQDNRIENLRCIPWRQNFYNTNAKGYWKTENGKWRAHIMKDNKSFNLGTYSSEEEAREVYLKNKERLHRFDEHQGFGSNNPPLPMSKVGDKEYDA